MKNSIGMFGIVLLTFLLQTTFLPPFVAFTTQILGVPFFANFRIDLVFLTLLYLSMHRGFWGVLVWASIIGEMSEIFGTGWKGAATCSSFAVAFLGLFISQNIVLASGGALIGMSIGIYFLTGFCHLFMGGVFARIPDPFEGQIWFLLFQSLLNGLLAPLIFIGLEFLDRMWRRKPIGSKPSLLTEDPYGHSYF